MSEREPGKVEQQSELNPELAELTERAAEHSGEKLEKETEKQLEKAEQAREAIKHIAEEEVVTPDEAQAVEVAPPPHYREVLKNVQHTLTPASKRFSKFIHNSAIEPTSEFLAKTVMRPSVVVGASVSALVLGGALYLYAKHYGIYLPGSFFVFSMLFGALAGLVVEYVRSKRSRSAR